MLTSSGPVLARPAWLRADSRIHALPPHANKPFFDMSGGGTSRGARPEVQATTIAVKGTPARRRESMA